MLPWWGVLKITKQSSGQKREAQKQYSLRNKEVKTRCNLEKEAEEAEEAASKMDSKTVYDIIRRLSGKWRIWILFSLQVYMQAWSEFLQNEDFENQRLPG